MRTLVFIFLLGAVLQAQDFRRFTLGFGGGPTVSANRFSDYVKNGYNLSIRGGVRATSAIEFLGQFDIHQADVQQSVLQTLAVPGGNANVYALTGNVKWNVLSNTRVTPYAIVGGGWYRRTVDFTEPTTREVLVFDPWWGFFQRALVPAQTVLGSVTRNAGGLNAGGGIQFDIGGGVRVFAEARFHRAYHEPTNTTFIPVTFGIQF